MAIAKKIFFRDNKNKKNIIKIKIKKAVKQ